MKYKVLEDLIMIKLENFISEYKNSSKLFANEENKNNLLHPGEYGMYKEKLLSSLFEFTLPKKYSCGSGFITNCDKEITSQCDIILYDAQNAPFLELSNNKFFSQEVVYAIGEVKSKLTKQQLFEALIKLSKNKQIRKPFDGMTGDGVLAGVNPLKEPYSAICTFLICDEIIGWHENISLEIQQKYIEMDVDIPYHFNIILSLKNGVIAYDVHKVINDLKKNNVSIDKSLERCQEHGGIASPFFSGIYPQDIVALDYLTIHKLGETKHLKEFLLLLNNFLINLKSYYPEPTQYFCIEDDV